MNRLKIATSLIVLALSGCGGGGGGPGVTNNTTDNSISTLAILSTPAIPTTTNIMYTTLDTKNISNAYPAVYAKSSNTVYPNPCDISSTIVNYPTSWNGVETLPTVKGAPLNKDYLTAISLKDIEPNRSLPSNCKNPDKISEFKKTIDRLKLLNTDIVQISQYHWMIINPDGTYTVSGDVDTSISDAELITEVNIAHAAGIKVMMNNQIQGFVSAKTGYNCCEPDPVGDAKSWGLWLDAYQRYMLNRAVFFQSLGIDIWDMGCNSCVYGDGGDNGTVASEMFSTAYKNILTSVSSLYTGKKLMHPGPKWINESDYMNGIDYIGAYYISMNTISKYLSESDRNNNTATVESIKKAYLVSHAIDSTRIIMDKFKKPLIVFGGGIQSRNDTLSNPGYIEEQHCTNSVYGSNQLVANVYAGTFTTGCGQMQMKPNFALQAIVIEAQLELFSELIPLGLAKGSVFMVYDYWQTDFIMSDTGPTFPHIGMSIRNKPAEGIVKKWFSR